MKSKLFVPLFVVGLLALVAGAVSFAKEELGPYQLLTTISIPGNLSGGFDISWVDSASERYGSVATFQTEADYCMRACVQAAKSKRLSMN